MENKFPCPVCGSACALLDVVDFNKSCGEARGTFLELSGVPVYYALCSNCGFCFAPEMATWKLEEFKRRIYNHEYALVDPDVVEDRPERNAKTLISMFGDQPPPIKHLDYGGGNGLLAKHLTNSGWQSTSYDPFVDENVCLEHIGKFALISAFEVFEHVPDVNELMLNLSTLLAPNGVVLLSTMLSDGSIHANERLTWWYASPRNGHISLFSRNSLEILAKNNGLNFASFSTGFHVLYTETPSWAAHIIGMSDQMPQQGTPRETFKQKIARAIFNYYFRDRFTL